jgi:inosose dehydratase
MNQPFHFATAPVSWGVGDYADASWGQSYETILDEIAGCGYTGTELGPFGYFPTDPAVLRPVLERRGLTMLSSFVPVALADADAAPKVIEHIRQVGSLLAAMKAPCIVLADEQSPERERVAGRVPGDGSKGLTAAQWKNVSSIVGAAEKVAADFGLDLVFHPHVATYVETPAEVEVFFDATSKSNIGLCLDTGHCYYGGGDPSQEASKYKRLLRYLHIKDIDRAVLNECHRRELDFNQAVKAGVFTPIGDGCLDFPLFFATTRANGYEGWCVVEQDIEFGGPVVPKDSMCASLRYLEGVVGAESRQTVQG